MEFEALQARYGDCLFITLPGRDRPIRLLIDGGPAGVFRTSLERRLIAEATKFPQEKPLNIDVVMVSHVDEDHILGILDLFGKIQDADQGRTLRPCQPKWLLHNSLDSLIGEGEGGVARALSGPTVLASLDAALGVGLPADDDEGAMKDRTARLVLQSYGQASKLATLAAAVEVSRNPPDQRTIMFEPTQPRVLQLGDATLTIVGPLRQDVDRLRKEWSAWKAKQKDTASLAADLDTSIPNLSSIVVLLQWGQRKILLTGDALGDQILEGLGGAGLMPDQGPLKIDILKLPHHGSIRNNTPDFFRKVHAEHYVASGDGTYGNPDRATLELLERARPEGGYTVHLTYDAVTCDATHKSWAAGRRNVPLYDPARDSITPVVERWRREGRIQVEEGSVGISL
ncbi:MAG: hypothetical protein V4564_04470 [Pseudomonadota bacterium]